MTFPSTADAPHRWTRNHLLLVVAAIASSLWLSAAMLILPRSPIEAVVVAAAPAVLLALVVAPWTRLALVVVGGLVVLGGDDSVGPLKIAYAGAAAISVLLSAWSLVRERPPWLSQFRLLIPAGLLFGSTLALGSVLSPIPWDASTVLRGSIFWLLIIAAPIVGLDAARSVSPKAAHFMVAALSLLTAIAFATQWLEQRGVSALGFGHFLMPSLVLPAVGFTLAFVQTGVSGKRQRVMWALLAAAIFIALIASGTRTNLLVGAAVLGTLGSRIAWRLPLRRAVSSSLLIALIVVVSTPVVLSIVISNPDFFATRIDAVASAIQGNIRNDTSFQMRQSQQTIALGIIGQHPWFGYGIGWVLDQILDTPLVTVVRIGLVGLVGLLVFLAACAIAIIRSGRAGHSSIGHTVASGSGVFFLALLLLASPVDDHGFGFALMLIFMLVGVHVRSQTGHGITTPPGTGALTRRSSQRPGRWLNLRGPALGRDSLANVKIKTPAVAAKDERLTG